VVTNDSTVYLSPPPHHPTPTPSVLLGEIMPDVTVRLVYGVPEEVGMNREGAT
jgi:hypothetical protein